MGDFSLPGLATGLDTTTIISQLMSIERRPVTQIQNQKAKQNTTLDRLRLLNTKMLALETAAKGVVGTSPATSPFGAKSAASSNNAVFTATATSAATPGSYTVSVDALAKSQKAGGNAFAGITANGTLQITNGTNTATINVTAGQTVDSVASAINADANSGLSASVVGGRLVLLGKATGAAEQYTLTETAGSGNLITELGLQASVGDVTAQDAQMTVAGIPVTSATNTFNNAINGLSLTAVSVGANETLTVSNDQSSTVNAIKDMIAKFNDVVNQIKGDQKYDSTTKTGGPLLGDSFVSNLVTQMTRMVTDQIAPTGQNAGIGNYTDVGISVQRDGTLSLDESKLSAKLASNPNEVYKLFANEDGAVDSGDPTIKLNQGANGGNMGDGLANRLRAFANSMTSASSEYNSYGGGGLRYEGGLLNRINGAQKLITNFDSRIDQYNRRLELREANLRAQFTAMETAVAALQSQGSYLAGQFGGATK